MMLSSTFARQSAAPLRQAGVLSSAARSTRQSRRLPNSSCQRCRQSASSSFSTANKSIGGTSVWSKISRRPLEYATIPAVAALVGLSTNWMGVKMLFYPIEYLGVDWYRQQHSPFGLIGWQGVVPTKTEHMASRLVDIVTRRLLSLSEAFGRLQPSEMARLLTPCVMRSVQEECGPYWAAILRPVLPTVLTILVHRLQGEIEDVLDLRSVVLSAFVRDKEVLVDLFQKVGKVELEFLVESGLGFGAALGLGQMVLWAKKPFPWTLPVAGALVGYITNWIAIKLLFEPADPVEVGPITLQGLFESRQVEVSEEFGRFMSDRVLSSNRLLEALADGGDDGELYNFLRRQLPYPFPESVISAAVKAIQQAARNPKTHRELHRYVQDTLDIEDTLSSRLKLLSPTDFEDLLHPVFQEDELTLIVVGGVLGAIAGGFQTKLGWGGAPAVARRRAIFTLIVSAISSIGFFALKEKEVREHVREVLDEKEEEELPIALVPKLVRRQTLVRVDESVINEVYNVFHEDSNRDH